MARTKQVKRMDVDEDAIYLLHAKMTSLKTDVFSRFGLASIPSADAKIERFEMDIERLKELPFFFALDRFMVGFFTRNGVEGYQISYAIWGGVAANLMLEIIGITRIHYSFHDAELFLLKDGNIYQPDDLIGILSEELSSNGRFLLDIGGRTIVKTKEGAPAEYFQATRTHLNDGDLYLNNVILIMDRVKESVRVEAPAGTFKALLAGADTLEVKDASDIRYIDRIARRIYRNISKSIRFEQVAGLTLSVAARECLEKLFDSYLIKLDEFFSGTGMSLEEKNITAQWIAKEKIINIDDGQKWLYFRVLSETAKRLAGLQDISSLDQVGFYRFLLSEERGDTSLFKHPLIELVQNGLTDSSWPSRPDVRLDIVKRCYLDFSKYQRPGAEKLRDAYSLP